jgi:hypothetical protein
MPTLLGPLERVNINQLLSKGPNRVGVFLSLSDPTE